MPSIFFFAPEGRDLLDQLGLVHHVGKLVHNDRRVSLVVGFVVHFGADQHGAAAGCGTPDGHR